MTTPAGTTDAAPTLTVEGLSVGFGRSDIIRDLSFAIAGGSWTAIIGPNGSGKTVLFKALIGALPFRGWIHWAAGTRIGYVPQKLDLERDIPMSGLDFLRARAALAPGLANREAAVADALALVGVPSEAAEQTVGTLSGGQFQRLLIAFALVGNPNVLLLDEPTSGIDAPGQERLNELLHRLQAERDLTALFISHELSVVYHYATEVLCLGRGVTCLGSPRQVLTPELLNDLYGAPIEYHVHDH